MIKRRIEERIRAEMFKGKAIILIGARQVGKSTLFRQIVGSMPEVPSLELNCDETEVKELLTNANLAELRQLIGSNRIVVIDEAQRVENVGVMMKRITDNMPEVQLLVTGSSSLDLQQTINEPLTGRKIEYHLFPISTAELLASGGLLQTRQLLEQRLIYGSYPDILNHQDTARTAIMNLAGSYLYKDLLSYEGIRRPMLLEKLLIALALQVGSEVKYNELAQTVGTDSKTVEKYIGLLEQCYVVFQLNAFSRNIRTELKKSKKVFFYDNGIRNAVLHNFAPLSLRQDIGALWENFVISERIKANHYNGRFVHSYFWRTTTKQEIDYIEEYDGAFTALEMKWNPNKASARLPQSFADNYCVKDYAVVTRDNYIDYL